jgi:hypothetical protein
VLLLKPPSHSSALSLFPLTYLPQWLGQLAVERALHNANERAVAQCLALDGGVSGVNAEPEVLLVDHQVPQIVSFDLLLGDGDATCAGSSRHGNICQRRRVKNIHEQTK